MISKSPLAIKVENVNKSFKLPHEKTTSLKSAFLKSFQKKSYEKQEALKNISFEVKKGEFFGIVGKNGSGKSTLLKCIAGVYSTDSGEIGINGKLVPFIELGVGFNPELSARDNVFLNGALLGFSRVEMEDLYDDIVEFAELDKFMDQKLNNFSSGMQVRLAFSIAIRAKSDVLLLDEVLAVGDEAFQQKCFNYFEELKRDKKTVVLVTHSMDSVKRFCDKALLIENGNIKATGNAIEVADQYKLDNLGDKNENDKEKYKKLKPQVKSLTANLTSNKKLFKTDKLKFNIEYELKDKIDVDLGFSIIYNSFSVAEMNSKTESLPGKLGKKHSINCSVSLDRFNPGVYSVDVAIFERSNFELIGYQIKAIRFIIEGNDERFGGPMNIKANWKFNDKN